MKQSISSFPSAIYNDGQALLPTIPQSPFGKVDNRIGPGFLQNIDVSGATTFNAQSYNWPATQVAGQLTNDGVGNLTWTTAPGGGDVVGPPTSILNSVARFADTTGKLITDSQVTINDQGDLTVTSGSVLSGRFAGTSGGTASSPLYDTGSGSGWYTDVVNRMSLTLQGAERWKVLTTAFRVGNMPIAWASAPTSQDIALNRVGSRILACYHGNLTNDAELRVLGSTNSHTSPTNWNGVCLKHDAANGYLRTAGAVAAPGELRIQDTGEQTAIGGQLRLDAFTAATTRDLQVDASGNVIAVALPVEWQQKTTDVGVYNLGSGTGIQPPVKLTGLQQTVPASGIAPADILFVDIRLQLINNSPAEGSVDVGFGINGAQPQSWIAHFIPRGSWSGTLVVNMQNIDETYPAGTLVDIWARLSGGTGPPYSVTADGSGTFDHQFIAGVR